MAEGIRHGVHHCEAMELLPLPHKLSFGVLFNEATRYRLAAGVAHLLLVTNLRASRNLRRACAVARGAAIGESLSVTWREEIDEVCCPNN